MRLPLLLLLSLALSVQVLPLRAQWQLQDAHTTADLRGIDAVGNGVAWASGTNGTVLRTEDAGFVWQLCTVPPDAEHLDFRGVQAFDNNTAIVMSSGKGDLSRLYKTTDGCQTWKLLFTNPDKDGFWDALQMRDASSGWLLGDPVNGRFVVGKTEDGGKTFSMLGLDADGHVLNDTAPAGNGTGAFAASNSSLFVFRPATQPVLPGKRNGRCERPFLWFGSGGPGAAKVHRFAHVNPQCSDSGFDEWSSISVPLGDGKASAGVFSLSAATMQRLVAVGGDYLDPGSEKGTAAYTLDGGQHWASAGLPPHGYRSAVAYDKAHSAWITVGPNGTDISTDDGRNWRALKPGPEDAPEADQHWNALSLPFVVGPHGRIGVLRDGVLSQKH